MAAHPIFLRRVTLKNYRSIAECSVELGALNFLVGPNGSGKSNFLDALKFTSDCLKSTVEQALNERGGFDSVLHRHPGSAIHEFSISLEWTLSTGSHGLFEFQIRSSGEDGFTVHREACRIANALSEAGPSFYSVEDGMVTESSLTSVLPAAYGDRFFLVAISGQPEFRPAYDALCRMGFYDFEPDRIRELQSTGPTEILASDGANLSSVFRRLGEFDKERQNRVLEYLTLVVPSISEVTVKAIGKKETLTFRQYGKAPNGRFNFNDLAAYGSCFDAESMSDGTLRALAVLVALFQSPFSSGAVVPLVALEEPETGLHPGASAVLRAALMEAAESTQILATNHSPDLLDDKEIVPGVLIAVKNTDGSSIIGPIDNASRSIIRDGLMTAGELLKQNQLEVVDVR